MNYKAVYKLLTTDGSYLETVAGDAISAFIQIKKADPNNYYRLKRYERRELAPAGHAKLDIGYGLSVAWTRVPVES